MKVKRIVVEEVTHAELVQAARKNRVSIQDLATHLLAWGLGKLKAGEVAVKRPELVEQESGGGVAA